MPVEKQLLNNRYQLIHLVSKNAGQQTWFATDTASRSQDQVVVKLLTINPYMEWDRAELFEREVKILRKLNHPRIPSYRDYFIQDQVLGSKFSWFCLVQSQVPGQSLQQLLKQGKHFTEAEVEKIAIAVLHILIYLHDFEPPILHRDIKPSNLILGEDNQVYLVDFGSVQDQAFSQNTTFVVVGTYGYVPMEQFGGQAVPASDLYALGASLIHLLTGVSPADLPHDNARIQFTHGVSVDRAFVNWIRNLTEPDLSNRFSTARLALDALKNLDKLGMPLIHRQPKGSCIQLEKSIDQLDVLIPRQGLIYFEFSYSKISISVIKKFSLKLSLPAYLYLMFMMGMFILPWIYTLNFFMIILNLLINMAILFALMIPHWIVAVALRVLRTNIWISVDRNYCTFCYQVFGHNYWTKKMDTAKLYSLINSNNQRIYLTGAMSRAEERWLIQEIKDWLDFGPSQLKQDLFSEPSA